jgi:uncharacterized protein YndB with AHSA1/START domain
MRRNEGTTMGTTFAATTSIAISAKAERVWDALTNPRLIKEYLFGTEAVSDWKVGSSLTYRGVWEGKPYEDKGTILELVRNRILKATYWSSSSGRDDTPENYLTVTYQLAESRGGTTLTITTDNNPTQEAADHVASNWSGVLQKLKELLEK